MLGELLEDPLGVVLGEELLGKELGLVLGLVLGVPDGSALGLPLRKAIGNLDGAAVAPFVGTPLGPSVVPPVGGLVGWGMTINSKLEVGVPEGAPDSSLGAWVVLN